LSDDANKRTFGGFAIDDGDAIEQLEVDGASRSPVSNRNSANGGGSAPGVDAKEVSTTNDQVPARGQRDASASAAKDSVSVGVKVVV
jgi:hypothetical protein